MDKGGFHDNSPRSGRAEDAVLDLLLDACRKLPRTCRAMVQLAGLFQQKGLAFEAEALLNLALRLPLDEAAGPAMEALAGIWRSQGKSEAAGYMLARAREAAGRGPQALAKAAALGLLGRNHAGDIEGLMAAGRNLGAAESAGAAFELARAYCLLGWLEMVERFCRAAAQGGGAPGRLDRLRRFAEHLWARGLAEPLQLRPSRETLDRNLAVLAEADPALAQALAPLGDGLDQFRVFGLPGGWLQILEPDGQWLSGDYAWWPELAALWESPPRLDKDQRAGAAVLINGMHGGAELDIWFQGSRGRPGSPQTPIYVLEPRPEVLALALAVRDLGAMLASGRVFFLAGPDAPRDLWRLLAAHPGYKRPNIFRPPPQDRRGVPGGRPPRRGFDLEQVVAYLNQEIGRWERPLLERLEAIKREYREISDRQWADILSGRAGRPVRILFLTGRATAFAQYSVRDCAAACRELGCQTRILTENSELEVISLHDMTEALEFRPDIFFTINYDSSCLGPARPEGAFFVSWVQDHWSPFMLAPAGADILKDRDFIIGYGKTQFFGKGYPGSNLIVGRQMTNPGVYKPLDLSPQDRARYQCEASLASHRSLSGEQAAARRQRLTEERYGPDSPQARLMKQALEALAEFYQGQGGLHLKEEMLEEFGGFWEASPVDPEDKALLASDLFHEVNDLYYRSQTLNWLADAGVDLHLWGRGWERHPRLARFARGIIPNGRELCKLYNASKINLHITCYSGWHQRFLDGFAAGGFFLLRHHPYGFKSISMYREILAASQRAGSKSLEDLIAACDEKYARYKLRELVAKARAYAPERPFDYIVDKVKYFLDHLDQAEILTMEGAMPWLPEISYQDREGLLALLDKYLNREDERRRIAAQSRRLILERFSPKSLMEKTINHLARFMASRISGRGNPTNFNL